MASATMPTIRARSSTPCPLRRTEPRDTKLEAGRKSTGARVAREIAASKAPASQSSCSSASNLQRELCTHEQAHERRVLLRQ